MHRKKDGEGREGSLQEGEIKYVATDEQAWGAELGDSEGRKEKGSKGGNIRRVSWGRQSPTRYFLPPNEISSARNG